MPIEDRSEAQSDPKNVLPANAKRIRFSFVIVTLLFIALALTAMLIWSRATL